MAKKIHPKKREWIFGVCLIAVTSGILFWRFHLTAGATARFATPQESDPYVRFEMEAYDKINQNYWMQPERYDLPMIFKLAAEKVNESPQTLATSTRNATAEMLSEALASATSTVSEKQIAQNTVAVVLFNLLPVGRNSLYSQSQEIALRQDVNNVNPSNDLYKNLGIAKGADTAQVNQAFKEKEADLLKATSTEAKTELQQVAYAHNVLTDSNSKALYDETGIEPTVFSHILGKTLYIFMDKISPTTLGEFARAVDSASTTPGLTGMILDLRGNIGGALDFLPNFLGLFMGPNQYAFDLFHQGDYQVQRTVQPKFDELSRYREMAVLTDNMTQSTAELTAETFRHFNLAKIVGTTTRGWGSVENTYDMQTSIDPSQKYSLLIVNSLTVRDDGQSIEGLGVNPDINISRPDWKSKLSDYFNSPDLIKALAEYADKPPLK